MSFNVTAIRSSLFAPQAYASASKADGQNFVKNSYAVQGNVIHPESRTNYSDTDYRGKAIYVLA